MHCSVLLGAFIPLETVSIALLFMFMCGVSILPVPERVEARGWLWAPSSIIYHEMFRQGLYCQWRQPFRLWLALLGLQNLSPLLDFMQWLGLQTQIFILVQVFCSLGHIHSHKFIIEKVGFDCWKILGMKTWLPNRLFLLYDSLERYFIYLNHEWPFTDTHNDLNF